MKGTLVLIVGATGSGKSALIAHVRQAVPRVVFPVSCTTRPIRPGEKDGENYFFISNEEFDTKVQNGEFLEWKHTDGKKYGTLKSQILEPVAEGKTVIREVEIRGAREILGGLLPPVNVRSIYIDGGTWESLEKRILARASMGEAELASRYKRFMEETEFKDEADVVIYNQDGKLDEAKKAFEEVVRGIAKN